MSSESALPERIEQACTALFRRPAIGFSRSLRSHVDHDPEYIKHHEWEVLMQMERYLYDAGVRLAGVDDRGDMYHVAREVVVRLRGIEKGEE